MFKSIFVPQLDAQRVVPIRRCESPVFKPEPQRVLCAAFDQGKFIAIQKIPVSQSIGAILGKIALAFQSWARIAVETGKGAMRAPHGLEKRKPLFEVFRRDHVVVFKFQCDRRVLPEAIKQPWRAQGRVAVCLGIGVYAYGVILKAQIHCASVLNEADVLRFASPEPCGIDVVVVEEDWDVRKAALVQVDVLADDFRWIDFVGAEAGMSFSPCAECPDIDDLNAGIAAEFTPRELQECAKLFQKNGIGIVRFQTAIAQKIASCACLVDVLGRGKRIGRGCFIGADTHAECIAARSPLFHNAIDFRPVGMSFPFFDVAPIVAKVLAGQEAVLTEIPDNSTICTEQADDVNLAYF